jgi:diguanylate cyclase (GGDEF)-like protein
MRLKKYRSAFLCSFVGSKDVLGERHAFVANHKYQSLHYLTVESLLDDVSENPPHFVVWYIQHFNEATMKTWLERFQSSLPETRILLITEEASAEDVLNHDFKQVYVVMANSEAAPNRLLREIDHAAENLVYMNLNEQLTTRLAELEAEVSSKTSLEPEAEEAVVDEAPAESTEADEPAPDDSLASVELEQPESSVAQYFDFQDAMVVQLSLNSCLEAFLAHVEPRLVNSAQAVYFKYNAVRKTIVASYGLGVDPALIEGIGLNLERVDPSFQRSEIRVLHERESFQNLLRDVFKVKTFHCHYLSVGGEVIGVFVHWGLSENSEHFAFISKAFDLLAKQSQYLDMEKRLHNVDTSDDTQFALKKHKFFQCMNEEVARARRTSLPLAFVLLSVDNFRSIEERCDQADLKIFLKSLAQIVHKHSRVNDILGRVSRSEFGLLLPHTAIRGGVVKAERLRRMIESANFGKVLKSDDQVTLSLAVSEYPSNCRDSDELFQSADQVLFDQDRFVANKVVVAKPPEGFIADFLVQDVKDSRLVR